MNSDINTVINSCLKSKTEFDLKSVLTNISDYFNCEYYTYCIVTPSDISYSKIVAINNYPDGYMNYYFKNQLQLNDPVINHCAGSVLPIFWKDVNRQELNYTKNCSNGFVLSLEYGVLDGVTIPIRGLKNDMGIYCIATKNVIPVDKLTEINATMQIISPYIYTALKYIHQLDFKENTISTREKECLHWISSGKTSWEASVIMGIKERTVNFHVDNIMRKLNCCNRQQLISKAYLRGFILPSIYF